MTDPVAETLCLGGNEIINRPGAVFPQSGRQLFVDVNNNLLFRPSTTPSFELNTIYRMPLSGICDGVCESTNVMNISLITFRNGLLFGLSDGKKAVMGKVVMYFFIYCTKCYIVYMALL